MVNSDVEELITHLGREDAQARRDALEQLGAQIPFREKQIAAALVTQLSGEDHFVRQAALELFGSMGEQALEVLVNDG
ncbi:MAG: HEAT repeat domain-containing protein, partial [Candidatus Thermoplasmatota archaeon]|nr:HEAT repeat domain-containing protein [Candidatus Thermoplasmatota archaeon]